MRPTPIVKPSMQPAAAGQWRPAFVAATAVAVLAATLLLYQGSGDAAAPALVGDGGASSATQTDMTPWVSELRLGAPD
jgi:hypothetical protein